MKKRPERTYKFHVSFSIHCFSRDPLPSEAVDADLLYHGGKESRVFCFDRHEYSENLPAIVKSFGDRTCWHTHHGNFFTIELLDKSGKELQYEVYFDVTRASHKGWLHLVIQSAYDRSDDYASTQPIKRQIRFDVIAYNRLMRKKILPGR